jgi:glycosyltransferase involved in cell wall biosynthesis
MAKISIIVPIYNVEKYICDCVESLQNQTLKDIEMILVDDGTPDNSGDIIDEYAKNDTRIKIIHKKNQGVSAARNEGLLAATGEYVIFCDSDDMMEPDACEKLYNAGEKYNADIVIGDVYRIIEGEKKYAQFFKHEFNTEDRKILDDLIRVDFSRKYCHDAPDEGPAFGYGGPWNKAVKRSFLNEKEIQFDVSLEGIFDDILFTAYIYAEAKSVVYIIEPIYDYRILEGSVTRSYKNNIIEINKAIFKAWNIFLNRYGADGRFNSAYNALVIRRLKGTLGTYFFNENNSRSIKEQKMKLKKLIDSEPYKTAVRNVSPGKLNNLYDLAVWCAAKIKSVLGLQIIYKLFVFQKSRL